MRTGSGPAVRRQKSLLFRRDCERARQVQWSVVVIVKRGCKEKWSFWRKSESEFVGVDVNGCRVRRCLGSVETNATIARLRKGL